MRKQWQDRWNDVLESREYEKQTEQTELEMFEEFMQQNGSEFIENPDNANQEWAW